MRVWKLTIFDISACRYKWYNSSNLRSLKHLLRWCNSNPYRLVFVSLKRVTVSNHFFNDFEFTYSKEKTISQLLKEARKDFDKRKLV